MRRRRVAIVGAVILTAFAAWRASRRADPEAPEGPSGVAAVDEVAVEVVDPEGRPVPGARVSATAESSEVAGTAGADGRCVLLVPASSRPELAYFGRPFRVRVEAEGYFHSVVSSSRTPTVRVPLGRPRALRGRVLDAESKQPVAGVAVKLVHTGCSSCEASVTRPDGFYELETSEGAIALEVAADGGPVEHFEFRSEPPSPCDLPFRPGVPIRGHVVDAVSGVPIAGANVRETSARRALLARTGADGAFEVRIAPVLATGRYALGVEADGRCAVAREWHVGELESSLPLRVPLPESARIEGTLRDPRGRGIGGVLVHGGFDHGSEGQCEDSEIPARLQPLLFGWGLLHGVSSSMTSSITTDDGRFTLEALVPWMSCYAVASAPNQRAVFWVRGGPLCGPGETTRVEATADFVADATLTGCVLLNGEPKVGHLTWFGPRRSGSAATDAQGKFVMNLEAGAIQVKVERESLTSVHEVEIGAGESASRDFDLVRPTSTIPEPARTVAPAPPAEPPERLRVRVVDAVTGEAIPLVEIAWRERGRESWSHAHPANDPEGWCDVRVAAGTLDVVVGARTRGYASVARRGIAVAAGAETELEVGLERGVGVRLRAATGGESIPGGRLWIALVRPDESELVLERVRARSGDATDLLPYDVQAALGMPLFPEREAYVSASEEGSVDRLAPGAYRLLVLQPEGALEPESIDVREPGEVFEVRWRPR